jgi:periplasmic protein CpxP/Spy
MTQKSFKQILLATGLAIGLSSFAYAEPAIEPGNHCSADVAPPMHHDREAPPRGMPMPMPMPMPIPGVAPTHEMAPPPYLHGIELSDAQQDKVFALMLSNAPQLHEQEKALRKSNDDLHKFLSSGQYDEAKIKVLAEAHAHALAQMIISHARSEHQILALLTPEQLSQVEATKAKFEAHGNPGLRAQIENLRP